MVPWNKVFMLKIGSYMVIGSLMPKVGYIFTIHITMILRNDEVFAFIIQNDRQSHFHDW